jgi:hypothetical protein
VSVEAGSPPGREHTREQTGIEACLAIEVAKVRANTVTASASASLLVEYLAQL